MLLLYSSCRDFLLSIVAGAEDRRELVRELLAERAAHGRPSTRWRLEDLGAMTDLQTAAVLWHVQVAEFRAMAHALGPRRARSLDCAAFLSDPAQGLDRLDAFFGLGLGRARTGAVARDLKLSRYAKQPRIQAAQGSQLDDLVAWGYRACPETPHGDPIGAALMNQAA